MKTVKIDDICVYRIEHKVFVDFNGEHKSKTELRLEVDDAEVYRLHDQLDRIINIREGEL